MRCAQSLLGDQVGRCLIGCSKVVIAKCAMALDGQIFFRTSSHYHFERILSQVAFRVSAEPILNGASQSLRSSNAQHVMLIHGGLGITDSGIEHAYGTKIVRAVILPNRTKEVCNFVLYVRLQNNRVCDTHPNERDAISQLPFLPQLFGQS
jgi:hypothetical protein